ncbi:DMT family transporter [Alphaproteobacteria bacterium]|nr:DMT family transporter [Alphaproteobacteria bacterium]MDB2635859.1 DMT family transporter [Alphaproteobacteria bacterium]MDB3863854.1 DMT family transporter [Alphaproteobacteria bacterium]
MIGYLLAICAAAIWSTVALSATRIVRYFGSYNYNLLRLLGIIVIFFPYVYINWESLYFNQSIFSAIVLSSIIGIIIGDTFLFVCLKRLGPRRQALLFSMQIPFTIILAEVFLQTLPSLTELIGCALIFSGILIAIQFNRTIPDDDLENIQGNKYTGLFAGIGLALCQSIGIILMKPALQTTDPIIVSYLRVIVAAVIMFGSLFFIKNNQLWDKMKNIKITLFSIFLGFMGMGVGMTMLIYALKYGNPGVISTLSSTMPIMIIPILWIVTKNYAGHLAVVGATLTCIGASIIFLA